jgi:hypothetical protein
MKTAVAILLTLAAIAFAQTPDCKLVPGWTQKGPARAYAPDNLFDYMDGNAEGYLIYQFLGMKGVNCQSGETTIVFDVSEMASPEAAYGLFSANRDPRQPTEKIGMAGQVLLQKALFCKDKYFVELAANPVKDHSSVLRSFVAAMEKRIEGRTALPDALAWFPTEKLVPNSIRLVPESVLGLRMLSRGFVAEYEYGKAFIVAEQSPESAAALMEKLKARLGETQPASVAAGAFQATDRYLGKLCVFRKGRHVGGLANLKPEQDATALAVALAARIP